MEFLDSMVGLLSHLVFITIFYHLLVNLFDWSKLIKSSADNVSRLKVFLLLLSIAIGYLASSFFLTVISLSQDIFFLLQ